VSPSVPVAAVDTGIERQSSSRPTLFCRQPSHLCCSRVSRLRRQDCSTPLFNSHPLSSRTFSKACTYMHICGCHCMCSLHLSPPRFRRFLFFFVRKCCINPFPMPLSYHILCLSGTPILSLSVLGGHVYPCIVPGCVIIIYALRRCTCKQSV
jgi:hypothetical protein